MVEGSAAYHKGEEEWSVKTGTFLLLDRDEVV